MLNLLHQGGTVRSVRNVEQKFAQIPIRPGSMTTNVTVVGRTITVQRVVAPLDIHPLAAAIMRRRPLRWGIDTRTLNFGPSTRPSMGFSDVSGKTSKGAVSSS